MKIGLDVSALNSAHQYRGLGFYTKYLRQALNSAGLNLAEFNKKPPSSVDLIHYPAFKLFTKPPKKPSIPFIVTVHDLIPLKFPTKFPLGIKAKFFWQLQKQWLAKAKFIITDSKASKKDIIKFVGLQTEKIKVIYLAADSIFKPTKKNKIIQKKYSLPNQFILFVGDLNWNKNIVNLTQACLKQETPLVVAGKQAASKPTHPNHVEQKDWQQFYQLASKNPRLIKRLGFVSTKDLVSIYNLATCLCLPSKAEGFGLPVLEAFACGSPVITSKNTSTQEIAGQAAILVDPFKPDQLGQAIKKITSNKALPQKLSKLGLVRSKQFSWAKTAQETIKVYEKACLA